MSTASKDNAGWNVAYTIAAVGEKTITFKTEDMYVDADARVTITTPAASSPTLNLTDASAALTMGTATNGVYSPTATLTGNAAISTAGWIASGNHSVSDTDVVVGTINQSTMALGATALASGDIITPASENQTITISEGYNTARTLVIGSSSSSTPGAVTSGTATISSLTYTYDSTNSNFTISGSANVSAPTVGTAGYISSSIGTLSANTNGASVSTTVNKITLDSTLSGTTTALKPTLSKQAISITGVTDAASDSATSTAPMSGVYVAVQSVANTGTITSAPTVNAAGYGTTSYFSVGTAATATVGAAQSDIYYIPIAIGEISSSDVSITSVTRTYNSSLNRFDFTKTATIPAPSVVTEGYISSTIGTKNTGTATVNFSMNKIGIKATVTSSSKVTPEISKDNATNIEGAGTATTNQPSSGYYIAVASGAKNATVQVSASVTSAGYGTTTSGQYTTTGDSVTVGANASAVTYIPITATTFANSGTSGVTYTDISNNVSALVSGDYLYINEGYVENSKISLAALIPDATDTNAAASYILSGYTAYDNDGVLIVGTMSTYTGTYTIT